MPLDPTSEGLPPGFAWRNLRAFSARGLTSGLRHTIFCADDFGLDRAVNEAVEIAHRDGVLGAASLMVSAPEAADAVARARRLPKLRVGLHLVLVEGAATRPDLFPGIVDAAGRFPSDQGRLGLAYADPRRRPALRAEIAAQLDAFAATGLPLDHVNAHKHMHLHPVVGALLIAEGTRRGLRALRVPHEPARALRLAGFPGPSGWPLLPWCALLRRRARRACLLIPDQVFGLAWSGAMTASRLAALAPNLPPGLTEIYLHPATRRTPALDALMPDYDQPGELAALLDPGVRALYAPRLVAGYAGAASVPP